MLLGWVNSSAIDSLSKFEVPKDIAGMLRIEELEFEFEENAVKLGMNPIIISDHLV